MSGTRDDCATVAELIGAYALDAVDPGEAEFVAAHLAGCPRCTQEYDRHRETAGLLAAAGGPAPEGVWDRIAGAVESDSPPSALPRLPRLLPGSRAPESVRSRRARSRWQASGRLALAAVGAAAVVMIGVQTARVNHLDHQVHQLRTAAGQPGGFQGLAAALIDPTAKHLVLTSTTAAAQPLGQLIILPSGSAYLVGARMATLPTTNTYQLWAVIAGRPISVGLLGAHPTTVAFTVDAGSRTTAYLLTVEPAGGVVAPTSAPVARALA